MTRKLHLSAAVAVVFGTLPAFAQVGSPPTRPAMPPTGFDIPGMRQPSPRTGIDDPKPVYKYELKPEHGEFLVLVKTFQGAVAGDETGRARESAEGLAEWIRTECRLYAYVHESGWAKRQERKKEKEAVEKAAREYYQKQGYTADAIDTEVRKLVKMARIPDEYSVLVAPGKGTLKTLDESLDFAKYLRKLGVEGKKIPPADFCEVGSIGATADAAKAKDVQNPLEHGMPGHNPTIAKKDYIIQRPKADDFLMSLNAGKPYSLIHKTTKPFTLVVQVYGTKFGQLQKPGDVTPTSTKSDGEMLERAAQQAQLVVEMLRKQNPPYDAYVLHTRYESFVCVGQYDSKDDAGLKANAKALAGLGLRDAKGQVIETFMEKPMPAMIPRP
jgi:hypothetical protein